jgi:hypothetical protein
MLPKQSWNKTAAGLQQHGTRCCSAELGCAAWQATLQVLSLTSKLRAIYASMQMVCCMGDSKPLNVVRMS